MNRTNVGNKINFRKRNKQHREEKDLNKTNQQGKQAKINERNNKADKTATKRQRICYKMRKKKKHNSYNFSKAKHHLQIKEEKRPKNNSKSIQLSNTME